jgi:nucleotide-binding universal stress UspA family protein
MTEQIQKLFIIPIDGSANSLNALDYIGYLFGTAPNVFIELLYIVPALSPILVDESRHNPKTAAMLKKMELKHISIAKAALDGGRMRLQGLGFEDHQIKTTFLGQAVGVAMDICNWAEKKSADAIVMSSRGRSRLESFFMGATANKVTDAGTFCPIWIILGKVTQRGILVAVDRSKEAMRAVDHAGFTLAQTDQPVTLFYSRRSLAGFIPRQVVEEAPDLERIWQDRAGKAIAPVMETARQILLDAGVAESRITVRVAEGTRSAAGDIIKTAQQLHCGTIIMGRRGSSGQSVFNMGSVSRKVIEGSDDAAIWVVP